MPCYDLAGFLHGILSPLIGNISFCVKNSQHFMRSMSKVPVDESDILLRFDVESLFTNVLVEKLLVVIKKKLQEGTLVQLTALRVDAFVKMLEVCLRHPIYSLVKFFQEKEGMSMGSSIPLVISNI
jgi:hypothetical protein